MWIELTRYSGEGILVNTAMLSNIEPKEKGCIIRGNSTTRSITVQESYNEIKTKLIPGFERDPAELEELKAMVKQSRSRL